MNVSAAARVPSGVAAASLAMITAFVCFGLVVPLAAVATRVAGVGGLLDQEVLLVVWATTRQAAWSTFFSALLGLPLGLFVGALDQRSRARVLGWLRVPYGVPTIVAATAWVAWLGRTGPLAKLDLAYSFTAVVIAHVFFNAPWIALLVAEARGELSEALVDAARTLGAGPWSRFAAVVWPSVRGAFAAAVAQAFALCSMSFALVLVLGGGPPVDTLETSLYARVRFGSLDLSGAAACAVWELVLTLVPWILVLLFSRERGRSLHSTRRAPSTWVRGTTALAIALIFVVPYAAVFSWPAIRSLAAPGLLAELGGPFVISLELAVFAAAGALLCAVAALLGSAWLARRSPWAARALEVVATVPAGVSVLVLGLGAFLAYAKFVDPLSGSLTAITGLQIVLFTPLAFRALWPVAKRTDGRYMEAASTLGASPIQAFALVEWPRWSGVLSGTSALVAAASLGEIAAVSLFYSERLVPLPLVISRWMAQYRFAEAQGLSALLLVASAGVVLSFGKGAPNAAG